MIRRVVLATLLAIAPSAFAQSPATPAPTIQATTQLVIVDVVVQDKSGKPLHNLKREDFQLTEDNAPQPLRSFDEHAPSPTPLKIPPPLNLPPGTFTNYTPVPPSGALNVLLIDSLNTPTTDQTFLRDQLKQYVAHVPPGTRIAIFGLSTHLTMLQGFSSDPAILKAAVEHKLIPRGSSLLDDPSGTHSTPESPADQASDLADSASNAAAQSNLALVAANLQQFEAQTSAFQTNLRTQYTLDAFNTLGHYLAALPGRKNLLWFSGSFPINILPDPSIQNPFAVMESNSELFQQTTSLLSKAQVAVYPIDARGLMVNPVFDVASSGKNYTRHPQRLSDDIAKFNQSQADEHSTMEQLADDTGGHAFYNTNGLADAVASAIDLGSSYYTVTYTPTNRTPDGKFHTIKVKLSGDMAANAKLSYRHGYFANKPASPTSPATGAADNTDHLASAYGHAALAHGAPTPEDILFKVRVLPASTETEPTVAKDNQENPSYKVPGPWQRYVIDFAALANEFSLPTQANGLHEGSIEFIACVYDSSGRLLNNVGKTISIKLSPDTYQRFLASPVSFHLEVSVPARQETYLRLAIHDIPTNHFGVVELPTSSVSRLPPAPVPAGPSR